MPHSKRKCHKLRGKTSHGHGHVGKHRKHPGGRGNAGGQHHMRIWFDRYHPGYFGKLGMRTFHKNTNSYRVWSPAINVDSLWALAGQAVYDQAKQTKGKAPVIDIVEKGYVKVTGRGLLPKVPLIVRAKFFTKEAERKIKAAGGACELRA